MGSVEPITALPWVNWIFWGTLAPGTIAVVGATEFAGGTTAGYRRFMAAFGVVVAGLWLLSEISLPPGLDRLPWGVAAFTVVTVIYLLAAIAHWPRAGLAVGAGLIGLATLVSLALEVDDPGANLWAVQLLLAAAALGAVNAAMLLGHWYLVTPQLSPTPLRRMMAVLLVALVFQLFAFLLAIGGTGGVPATGAEVLVWLRLMVGILIPIGITVLAWLASQAASLQASTGLLYIGLALVIAGTIGGASLTFWTGVPL